jgi:hypothetical protein
MAFPERRDASAAPIETETVAATKRTPRTLRIEFRV